MLIPQRRHPCRKLEPLEEYIVVWRKGQIEFYQDWVSRSFFGLAYVSAHTSQGAIGWVQAALLHCPPDGKPHVDFDIQPDRHDHLPRNLSRANAIGR